jgi:hypothetical protein
VPTEIPKPPDLEQVLARADGWLPTRTQMALMLVASVSGYIHWPVYYLLALALAWVSLETQRSIALGLGLGWDVRYWIWTVWTSVLFLLGPFEVGRLISMAIDYFHG